MRMTCKNAFRRSLTGLIAVFAMSIPPLAVADQHYVQSEAFIEAAFTDEIPTSETLWLTKDIKKDVNKIMGHKNFRGLRVRYHRDGTHTVWVLEEIGKYKPITVGISVRDSAIEKLQVLAYRDSHGWEVKQDFFTRQFIGAKLSKKWRLDEDIDGISGATLSVRALKKLARLALYFDSVVQAKDQAAHE